MRIAILGSTGHIGRALSAELSKTDEVFMFGRKTISCFHEFRPDYFDITINCIGVGTPIRTALEQDDLAVVNDKYDCERYMAGMYVYISSGIVYPQFRAKQPTPYEIVKLHSELRHRSMDRWIIDFRVFGFLSQFIDMDSGYLFTDLLQSMMAKKEITISSGMKRCYWGARDLALAIKHMYSLGPANAVFDCINEPITSERMAEIFDGNGCIVKLEDRVFPRKEYVIENPKMYGYTPTMSSEAVVFDTISKILRR